MDSPAHVEGRRRVLAGSPRLRLAAITLWSGFLGAALTLFTALALLPAAALHGAGWQELSVGFLCAWVLAMVPVSLALLLALPRRILSARRDGR